METCAGDDVSYQIPIATTITFDGVEYNTVYATTNSVITFGQPDGTYWDYPQTPSISLYSMDWYPHYNQNGEGLTINYSNGGFQINLIATPYGMPTAEQSSIMILVAITNTGELAVSYSYSGPEYEWARTGVRLHSGEVVSLEAWGATALQPGEVVSLDPTPVVVGPTQEEIRGIERARIITSLISAAVGASNVIIPEPEIIEAEIVEPEVIEPEVIEPEVIQPEPDVVVQPEIITPEDPRFPENILEEKTESPSEGSDNNELIVKPEDADGDIKPDFDDKDLEVVVKESPKSSDKESTANNISGLIADLTSKDSFMKLTESQKAAVSEKLGLRGNDINIIQEQIENNKYLSKALSEFADRLESNSTNVLPYTLADVTTEVQAEDFLSNPIGAIFNVDVKELLSNFSQLGMDMTDDQRKKAQEVIIPVIIVSQIIGAFTRRIG